MNYPPYGPRGGYPPGGGTRPPGQPGYPQAGGARPPGQGGYPQTGRAYGSQYGFGQMPMPTPPSAAYDSTMGGPAYPAQPGAPPHIGFGTPQSFGATQQGYGVAPQGYGPTSAGSTQEGFVTRPQEMTHAPVSTAASVNPGGQLASPYTTNMPKTGDRQPVTAHTKREVAVADLLNLLDLGDMTDSTTTKPTDVIERHVNNPIEIERGVNKSKTKTNEDVDTPVEVTSQHDDEPPPEALYEAILKRDRQTVVDIVMKNPLRANNPFEGITPLMFAANNDKVSMIKLLLDLGVDINSRGSDDCTALRSAIMGNNEECVELLLERGVDVTDGEDDRLLAHMLVAFRMHKPLRHAILKGCDVNAQDVDGNTTLHNAIWQDRPECVEVLVGCSRTDMRIANNDDFNVFHVACQENNTFAAQKILARDPAIVDVATTKLGLSALHLAARSGNFKCGQLILDKSKESLNKRARTGKTPLHMAAEDCSRPFIQLLIDNGADVNITDWRGDNPLHSLFGPSSNFTVRLRISSVLFEDEIKQFTEASILLLKAQTGYNRRNAEGITPLEMCRLRQLRPVLDKYIRENEGSLNGDPGPATPKANLVVASAPHKLTPCYVCIEMVADVIFKPCQHKVLCFSCSKDTTHCPECGAAIEDREDDPFKMTDMCPVQ